MRRDRSKSPPRKQIHHNDYSSSSTYGLSHTPYTYQPYSLYSPYYPYSAYYPHSFPSLNSSSLAPASHPVSSLTQPYTDHNYVRERDYHVQTTAENPSSTSSPYSLTPIPGYADFHTVNKTALPLSLSVMPPTPSEGLKPEKIGRRIFILLPNHEVKIVSCTNAPINARHARKRHLAIIKFILDVNEKIGDPELSALFAESTLKLINDETIYKMPQQFLEKCSRFKEDETTLSLFRIIQSFTRSKSANKTLELRNEVGKLFGMPSVNAPPPITAVVATSLPLSSSVMPAMVMTESKPEKIGVRTFTLLPNHKVKIDLNRSVYDYPSIIHDKIRTFILEVNKKIKDPELSALFEKSTLTLVKGETIYEMPQQFLAKCSPLKEDETILSLFRIIQSFKGLVKGNNVFELRNEIRELFGMPSIEAPSNPAKKASSKKRSSSTVNSKSLNREPQNKKEKLLKFDLVPGDSTSNNLPPLFPSLGDDVFPRQLPLGIAPASRRPLSLFDTGLTLFPSASSTNSEPTAISTPTASSPKTSFNPHSFFSETSGHTYSPEQSAPDWSPFR